MASWGTPGLNGGLNGNESTGELSIAMSDYQRFIIILGSSPYVLEATPSSSRYLLEPLPSGYRKIHLTGNQCIKSPHVQVPHPSLISYMVDHGISHIYIHSLYPSPLYPIFSLIASPTGTLSARHRLFGPRGRVDARVYGGPVG